jgi:uncharacterized small protein (DUF1192 family)
MMEPDEPRPTKAWRPLPLDALFIDELDTYAETLAAEIERVEAHKQQKQQQMSVAAALFKS